MLFNSNKELFISFVIDQKTQTNNCALAARLDQSKESEGGIAKISLTSSIDINVITKDVLVVQRKSSFVLVVSTFE